MNLPPLPDLHPGAGYRAGEVREMLQAYGRQCREAALKEAVELCNNHAEEIVASGRRLGVFDPACEGLAEELRDLPEPYDQQALELCPVCDWKAIVPGEPRLMCERNAKMLVPKPEPTSDANEYEREARQAAQADNEALKAAIARHQMELNQATLAERERILAIAYEQSRPFGWQGEAVWTAIKAYARNGK